MLRYWSHFTCLLLFVLFCFIVLFAVVHGSKVFYYQLESFPLEKKKIRSQNLYGGLCAFALDVNRLAAVLCHSLVHFIVVVAVVVVVVVVDLLFFSRYTLTQWQRDTLCS